MSELRQRRHEQTKRAIVTTALRLFEERGYEQVTMEDIAEAAGISRSTLYRRFPNREHVILEVVRRWLDVWDDRHAAADPDEPRLAVLEACCLAVAAHIDDVAGDVRITYAARAVSPELATHPVGGRAWLERVAGLLDEDPAAAELDDDDKHVIAGAYVGAVNGMMARWIATGAERSVVAMTEAMLERLRPIWPG